MEIVDINSLLELRLSMAMNACGIWDEEEIELVEPISYLEKMGAHTFVTVWLFGFKKIYSAMMELVPGEYDAASDGYGQQFVDVYKFKNIDDIRYDEYGCVITLSRGKKIELKPTTLEGIESFASSCRGLVHLWDEYDD